MTVINITLFLHRSTYNASLHDHVNFSYFTISLNKTVRAKRANIKLILMAKMAGQICICAPNGKFFGTHWPIIPKLS